MATTALKASFYIKRTIGFILLLALAAVFLFSAYSKIDTLQPFEWTFIDLGIKSNTAAAIVARLFIGLEIIVGLFLLFHIYLRSVTYPLTLIFLVALTGYLVILIAQHGNTGNCGCFGQWIYMKPMEAIWKNLIMMAVTILLMYIYPIKPYKNQEWVSAVIAMSALVIPMIMAPLNLDNKPVVRDEVINLNPLYREKITPRVELRKGKHIVAFMSLTCPHCRKAAYLMHIIHSKHPQLPLYIVLSGHPDQQEEFFKETQSIDVPHMLFRNTEAFGQMAGNAVPAIYWIYNSTIEYESNYNQLDPAEIEKWLKQ